MNDWMHLGPRGTVHLFGVKLVGLNVGTAEKLIVSLLLIAFVLLAGAVIKAIVRFILRNISSVRVEFWTRQGLNLLLAFVLLFGLISIWFDDPSRLATGLGLVTAGLAFALQKVVTSIAGYFVILRGKTFNVGDRIVMGGVRGDVIALGFMQTSIMEMGQPPDVQDDRPAMWVKSRQYTGRIVTVPNSKIFDEPIYNYTKDFEYIWEELAIPVSYDSDHEEAEKILLDAALRFQTPTEEISTDAAAELERRYYVLRPNGLAPHVYYRLTDNWLELSVRFVIKSHGIREVKDAMSRQIIKSFSRARIRIASSTFEVTHLPPLKVEKL